MYPILEFDSDRNAFINPLDLAEPLDVSEHCVLCFFGEVVEKVARDHHARLVKETRWEDGPHRLYEIDIDGRRLAFFQPGVGGPIAAGLMEEIIAYGCRKFIAVGGCGALEKDLNVGHLIVVQSAVRDEGVSYHYLEPSREIPAQPEVLQVIEEVLNQRGLPYRTGKTWTTDAPYRETKKKIADRRKEGCLTVEMEAASLMAVASFRGAKFGQILYAGDDLSGEKWDNRGWQSREDIREALFWTAAEICLGL